MDGFSLFVGMVLGCVETLCILDLIQWLAKRR